MAINFTDIILNFIPDLYASGVKRFKYKQFIVEEELGIVYQKYLEHEYKKYSLIKTLLYKNEAKNLYNFYEHVKLKNDVHPDIYSEDTQNIFRANKNVLITGTGGIGKSLLMRHIFLDQLSKSYSMPIFIELKNLNHLNLEDFDIEKYIHTVVHNNHLKINSEYFNFTLEKGVYTLIFDGYDEIIASHVNKIQSEIKRLGDKFPDNNFVVSSRPSEQFIGWESFTEYEISELDKEQAISLINRLDYDTEVKKKFSKELNKKLYENHTSFASIPLLLTIMLMTYEAGATIPDDLTEFYNQAFYALYQKHDASKSGYRRELKAGLSPEEFKEYLAYVALKTFFSDKVSFPISLMNDYLNNHKEKNGGTFHNTDFLLDATHSACMLFREGDMLRFSHRSFQEFFAGVGVSKINDEIQRKILLPWAEYDPNNISYNGAFVSTLLSLQKDSTFSNLFVPLIQKFEDLYVSLDLDTSKLISEVFSFFISTPRGIGFNVKNQYNPFFDSHFLILKKLNVNTDDIDDDEKINQDDLWKYNKTSEKIVFDEIDNPEVKNLIITFVDSWLIRRLEYLIDWKNEVNNRSKTKKRKFLNIVDEL